MHMVISANPIGYPMSRAMVPHKVMPDALYIRARANPDNAVSEFSAVAVCCCSPSLHQLVAFLVCCTFQVCCQKPVILQAGRRLVD